jgi:HEPN domain-containing protein
LLKQAGPVKPEILTKARLLDRYYVPPRYPNGFAEGAPMDYYDQPTAKEAVDCAQDILEFVKTKIKGL